MDSFFNQIAKNTFVPKVEFGVDVPKWLESPMHQKYSLFMCNDKCYAITTTPEADDWALENIRRVEGGYVIGRDA